MTIQKDSKVNTVNLELECQQWHSQIFGFPPSPLVLQHYKNANLKYQFKINKNEQDIIGSTLDKKVDLEALEFFWRFKNKNNILTQKKMVLLSICELFPEYKNYYTNFKASNFIKAFLLLTYYTIRSVYKLIKGAIIFFIFIKPNLLLSKTA